MTGQIILKRNNLDFSESVTKYGSRLLGFIRSKVRLVEDAEDILQDVWYQYFSLDEGEEIDSISGWLYRVAKNKVFDYYRKRKPVLSGDVYGENDESGLHLFEPHTADSSENPETDYSRYVFIRELKRALEELPEEQRNVFIKNEIDGLTLKEIAASEGENLKTIISRKGYAVKRLREKLGAFNNGI